MSAGHDWMAAGCAVDDAVGGVLALLDALGVADEDVSVVDLEPGRKNGRSGLKVVQIAGGPSYLVSVVEV